MSTIVGPTYGPCDPWISGEDVAAQCDALDSSGDHSVYDIYALQASEMLWAASGRQFSGACGPVTVRPCVPQCGCWIPGYEGLWNAWSGQWGYWIGGGGGGLSAVQSCGGVCCGYLSRVKLSGYPVTAIDQVKIGGDIVPAEDYRLDHYKYLTYMADADGNPRRWPACQALDRDDTEPGTFSVSYTHGVLPPQIGLDAAVQLACHLAQLNSECEELPAGTEEVDRQGIRIRLQPWLRGQLPPGFAGLSLVQAFLATVNPYGLTRRTAFWSPDSPRYAERLG